MAIDLLHRVWQRQWIPSPLDYPLWAYCVVMAVSSILSIDLPYSLGIFSKTLIPMLIVYHSIWQQLLYGRSIRHLAWTVALAAILVVSLGFFFLDMEGDRIEGIFPVATRYGKYLDLVIPLTFGLLFSENSWKIRALLGTLAGSEIVGLFWSGTRGAFVALMGVLLALVAFNRRLWPILALCLGLVSGFLWISPANFPLHQRIADLISPVKLLANDPALQDRKGYYRSAWAMIREQPILGWGYGNHIAKYISKSKDSEWFKKNGVKPLLWHAHNLVLEILLEGGIVALVVAIWIGTVLGNAGVRILYGMHVLPRPLILGFLLGLCALGIHSLVTVPQWSNSLLAVVYLAVIMVYADGHYHY